MQFSVDSSLAKKSGVYLISNSIDNRVYVGATLNFKNRFNSHLCTLKAKTHSDKQLQAVVDEVGIEHFCFTLLALYTDDSVSLRDIEQSFLNAIKSSTLLVLINSTLVSNFREDCQLESPVTISLKLSRVLLEKAKAKAKQAGVRFSEYVRHLIANDLPNEK